MEVAVKSVATTHGRRPRVWCRWSWRWWCAPGQMQVRWSFPAGSTPRFFHPLFQCRRRPVGMGTSMPPCTFAQSLVTVWWDLPGRGRIQYVKSSARWWAALKLSRIQGGSGYRDALPPDGKVGVPSCQHSVLQEGRAMYRIDQPVMDAETPERLGSWKRRDRKHCVNFSTEQHGKRVAWVAASHKWIFVIGTGCVRRLGLWTLKKTSFKSLQGNIQGDYLKRVMSRREQTILRFSISPGTPSARFDFQTRLDQTGLDSLPETLSWLHILMEIKCNQKCIAVFEQLQYKWCTGLDVKWPPDKQSMANTCSWTWQQ